jgi:hypothetical protein
MAARSPYLCITVRSRINEAGKSRLASRRTGSCGIASAVKHGCGDDRLELAQGMFDPADN